ncbi:MAG TPA: AraC family transcriptional regulator [Vicinamibacteria bacterium]|nr:AraC family transcriptional regulator [Vicinamibacteria bacterium]
MSPLPPLERVVYADGKVEVGAFRCAPARPDFRQAGQIRSHCAFVFPRRGVRIRQEGRAPFTADRATVVFYNPRQPYTRERLDPAGDACEWFAVDPATAAEVVRERDPAAAEREEAPFRLSHGPSDAASYFAQRALFHELEASGGDALAVEERVLLLLDRALALAYGGGARPAAPAPLRPRERTAALQARDLLALRFAEPLTLEALARETGLSRFRLCRAFRAAFGTTLHAYREQLRLRAALDALGEGCRDLTALALDLGYSSHSHFTAAFGKAFAVTPSQARARFGPSAAR